MQNNKEKLNTFGDIIKQTRTEKNMTIEELAEEFSKSKIKVSYKVENKFEYYKKKIKSWELNKDYPDLDEIYELSSILEINPNKLLIMRNTMRNNYKKINVFRKESKLFNEMPDTVYFAIQFILRVIIFLIIIFFIVKYCILIYGFTNGGAKQIDEAVENLAENFVDNK